MVQLKESIVENRVAVGEVSKKSAAHVKKIDDYSVPRNFSML